MTPAIIIEDELPAQMLIKKYLEKYKNEIALCGIASNGHQALDMINTLSPKLIFIDIHLPDMNGFDVLQQISAEKPFCIFTTAYEHYALEAFNHLSIEYLIKPFTQDRFDQAIEKTRRFIGSNHQHSNEDLKNYLSQIRKETQSYGLTVQQGGHFIILDYDDITFISAEDKYLFIYCKDGKKYLKDKTLTAMEEGLPAYFKRIHRSHIINTKRIHKVYRDLRSRYVFVIDDLAKSKITSSLSYKEEIKGWLGL